MGFIPISPASSSMLPGKTAWPALSATFSEEIKKRRRMQIAGADRSRAATRFESALPPGHRFPRAWRRQSGACSAIWSNRQKSLRPSFLSRTKLQGRGDAQELAAGQGTPLTPSTATKQEEPPQGPRRLQGRHHARRHRRGRREPRLYRRPALRHPVRTCFAGRLRPSHPGRTTAEAARNRKTHQAQARRGSRCLICRATAGRYGPRREPREGGSAPLDDRTAPPTQRSRPADKSRDLQSRSADPAPATPAAPVVAATARSAVAATREICDAQAPVGM